MAASKSGPEHLPSNSSHSSNPSSTTKAAPSASPSASASSYTPPSSILIIGSGVFGLSTALALTQRPVFANTSITVVDRSPENGVFPARDASSIDTSRIIRPDYADPAYCALANQAQVEWRKNINEHDLGGQGRYNETGLMLVGDAPSESQNQALVLDGKGDLALVQAQPGKKSGLDYVRASWENVKSLASSDASLAQNLHELPTTEAIRERYGTGGSTGSWGYINSSSGWAEAEACMDWLYARVKATGRVQFVNGTVTSLAHTDATVTGATLSTGQILSAELVILSTGAWTSSLIDLAGQATSTGQIIAYIDLTDEEQAKLSNIPTILNLTTGYFIITPRKNVLKIARHAYGYLNPTTAVTTPLKPPGTTPSSEDQHIATIISYPVTHLSDPELAIPESDQLALREALCEMVPFPTLRERPFTKTKLCWYTDTPSGDFIIDHHPYWQGLFVATGGSGHGFKFLPVIGNKIVDCVVGKCPEEFKTKWAWKDREGTFISWDKVSTQDGSRGGRPGVILQDEMAKNTNYRRITNEG